ncbi:hypothetical protein F4780DRAFT_520981 [Xylariomycetidae sp. FL0641]|nr:hypothetical protein F4780DRAFT_520981 [Xylariomycetidae sp. FL0641]
MQPNCRALSPEESSDYDDVPLQDRRPFGSGLKRKRVVFVPASTDNAGTKGAATASTGSSTSASNAYLSIVLPKEANQATSIAKSEAEVAIGAPQLCQVCSLPVKDKMTNGEDNSLPSRPHEASIAHQVCLTHSHPPSSVDRSRMGLGVLQTHGWDPDARTGLGALQQGMQYPIKVKPKNDNLGIGVEVPKAIPVPAKKREKVQKIDAKKARKVAAEDKKRFERLRQQFYGNPDVDRYLSRG